MTARNTPFSPWRGTHHRNGRFFNPATPRQRVLHLLRWIAFRKQRPWRNWIPSQPGPPPQARVDGAQLRVTFVNHATFLLQMHGLNLLTDPVWSHRVSPVGLAGPRRRRAPGIRFSDLPPVDAVLLSHNHYDHCDLPTLRQLARRDHPAIFCPLGLSGLLHRAGFGEIYELDWWQSADWRGLPIHCVPAQHFASRTPFDRNRTLWCGWAVNARGGTIYFGGDTGFGDLFEEIAREFPQIRLALLPIGAYAPEWFMRPIHMTPEETLRAHEILRASHSIAGHYGTFALADDGEAEPLERLAAALQAVGNSGGFHVLAEGVACDIPEFWAASALRKGSHGQ
jgi:L-ascorbate metabolism protein UlaG (beta-lactamase superfamily)